MLGLFHVIFYRGATSSTSLKMKARCVGSLDEALALKGYSLFFYHVFSATSEACAFGPNFNETGLQFLFLLLLAFFAFLRFLLGCQGNFAYVASNDAKFGCGIVRVGFVVRCHELVGAGFAKHVSAGYC